MTIHVSPTLGGALVSNARGRPVAPTVPMWRVGREPLPTPPRTILAPATACALPVLDERERLPDPIPADIRAKSVAPIVSLVAGVYGLRVGDVKGPSRKAALVKARQSAMWIARRFTGRSLPEIGRVIGDRDHTTVLHGCRRVEKVVAGIGHPPEDTPEAWATRLMQAEWPRLKSH